MKVEVEEIKQCVREVLAERSTVDVDVHKEQHACLSEILPALLEFLEYRKKRMAQLKKREEFLNKMADTAVGVVVVALVGGAITLLGMLGRFAWQTAVHVIQTTPNTGS